MLKYIFKRILFAILALFLLLVLVFFLMQAIPGYPLHKDQNWTDKQYYEQLQSLGLLENPIVQFFKFIGGIFRGEFGQIYNSNGQTVVEHTLLPMKYTIMVAFPAFILSAIIGIGLGILSAYFRGRWVDNVINTIAVLFMAIPSFVFALYLIKLAGVIGLPVQFISPGNGTVAQQIKSMIMPITAMTLSSISVILYYTRNELVDVFKQDYIKTALAKGISFGKVIFVHALRNALIPILAALLPSFIGILSGSIIIEKFFNIPGTSSILINAINNKEIYIVLFKILFYSGIYFLLQIILDISFSFIDPRIKLAESKNISFTTRIKSKIAQNNSKKQLLNTQYNYFSFNNQSHEIKEVVSNEVQKTNFAFISKHDIQQASLLVPEETSTTPNYELPEFIASRINNNHFQFVKSNSYNNEQIVGKPSTYIKDVCKRFFKSKVAIVFTALLGIIILLSIIIPLATPNSTNIAIGGLSSSIVDYLPPRIPFLGISGIIDKRVVSEPIYYLLLELQNTYNIKIFTSAVQQGSSWVLSNYNAYAIPALSNVFPLMGTDGLGRDWWNMMWYATAKSLIVSIIASAGAVVIGTIYGSVAGTFAGRTTDTVMMRIVEIISGVPLIIWVIIISMIVSGGTLDIFTIAFTLIITGWMGSAIISRTFILKYKDAEFVQAAQTLGASKFRIIFSHLIPNIIGRLLVVFVNKIPVIIFFETSLVFLGLKSSNEVSLGTMINTAWESIYPWLLIGPTLTLVLTTLSSIIISNHLNDSIDPRIIG